MDYHPSSHSTVHIHQNIFMLSTKWNKFLKWTQFYLRKGENMIPQYCYKEQAVNDENKIQMVCKVTKGMGRNNLASGNEVKLLSVCGAPSASSSSRQWVRLRSPHLICAVKVCNSFALCCWISQYHFCDNLLSLKCNLEAGHKGSSIQHELWPSAGSVLICKNKSICMVAGWY